MLRTADAKPAQKTDLVRLARIAIVALAFLLRLYGIGWALPTASRWFSYHTDESTVVRESLGLNPLHGQFDPHFYNYGSLSLLLNAWVIQLGHLCGLVTSGPIPGVASASELLCARLVTVTLGAFTCAFLYGAGHRLFNKATGLLAALAYALAPLAVQHGHWATVDVPATFWMTGSLYFAARALTRHESGDESRRNARAKRVDFLLCGVMAGLAAATKYNAGLILLPGLAAYALQRGKRTPADLLALVGATAAGFVLGCPAIILNPASLIRDGILFEANHVAHGEDVMFRQTASGFLFHIGNLNAGLGTPLLLVAALGFLWALRQRKPADYVLLSFTLPYYLLIGLAQIKFARYTIPLFPPLLLFTARLIACDDFRAALVWRRIGAAAFALAAACGLLFSVAIDQTMALPDTRDRAAEYIRKIDPPTFDVATDPWFYTPPLGPLLNAPARVNAVASARRISRPALRERTNWWDFDDLTGPDAPDAFILSEFEYRDAFRIADTHVISFVDGLPTHFAHRAVFAQPMEVFGIPFAKPTIVHGVPVQPLPYDMLYTNPTTIVYTR